MNLPLIHNQIFQNQDFVLNLLPKGEYTDCRFFNCNFENSDLSNSSFLDCEFVDCNLSNVNVMHTTFNDVNFKSCKIVGVQFQNCNDLFLAFNFKDCILNISSFYQLKINNTQFLNCIMHHIDFTETEAKKASFLDCNLKDSIFDNTNLEHANFYSAYNFTINPSNNKLKNALFSKTNCSGLLNSFQIKIN